MDFLHFFTDPVLRAPTIGSMLMCVSSALVGAIAVLRKRSLIGESLSHASYPGVVLGVITASLLFGYSENIIACFILIGAFIFSILGLVFVEFMEKKLKVKSDAALCFILSTFLGVGILIASRIQITHALWYRQIQVFLYGQAATMTDIHIWIYGIMVAIIFLFVFLLYPQIKMISFDRVYAQSMGVSVNLIDSLTFLLLVLAIVIGIRSVGVVMMSGMLIAPAIAGRQFTNKLSMMLFLSAGFGLLSGFLGNYFSIKLPLWLTKEDSHAFFLPTGPMIILVAGIFCFASLLFAPKRGVLFRTLRILHFNYQCLLENALKAIWKFGSGAKLESKSLKEGFLGSYLLLTLALYRLRRQGFLEKKNKKYSLTSDGEKKAKHIVRLHRLWEVYLVSDIGVDRKKVHASAEEMEHVLNEELEERITYLLQNPMKDPHHQPIPKKGEIL